jgi:hypothetical protein
MIASMIKARVFSCSRHKLRFTFLLLLWLQLAHLPMTTRAMTTRATRTAETTTNYGVETTTTLSSFKAMSDFAGAQKEFQFKFVLPYFQAGQNGDAILLSPQFYSLHDDWYIFHVLTGRKINGIVDVASHTLNFESPKKLRDYLQSLVELPSEMVGRPPFLVRSGDRILSGHFYDLATGTKRQFGLGSIIYSFSEKRPRQEILAFDMVFNDQPNEGELLTQINSCGYLGPWPNGSWLIF